MSHSFCKQLYTDISKKYKIKTVNIGTIKWNSNHWYVYIDPIGEIGCYRGCCIYDAKIQAIEQFIKYREKENQ